MSLNPELYLKWIDASNPSAAGISGVLTNTCAFAVLNEKDHVIGVTFFEPKDFQIQLIERMKSRLAKMQSAAVQCRIFLPPFLKHRFAQFAKEIDVKIEAIYTRFLHVKHAAGFFTIRPKIRVFSVDDSPVLLKFLKTVMQETEFVEVVGQSSDPLAAKEMILKSRPDVITMDIQMPKKNGVQLLQDVLATEFFPTIMISSLSLEEGSLVFEALNSGAFDYIQKPKLEEKKEFKEALEETLVCAVSAEKAPPRALKKVEKSSARNSEVPNYPAGLLWVLGASTGGTQALTQVFTSLPTKVPATLVVQHIPPVFSKAFANSLNQLVPYEVKEAEQGEPVLDNHVYIAPGGMQMGVELNLGRLVIRLADTEPVNRFKPSVDYLFNSVAQLKNQKIVSGIFTGMGKDGSLGLLALKEKGAITFAQDQKTSAVYGMPRAAVECGATDRTVPIEECANELLRASLSFAQSNQKKVANQ